MKPITDSPSIGADEQTIHHLITECPHTHFNGSLKDTYILTSQASNIGPMSGTAKISETPTSSRIPQPNQIDSIYHADNGAT